MNTHGICWCASLLAGRPFFVWRDQDRSHPAHLIGCWIEHDAPTWGWFDAVPPYRIREPAAQEPIMRLLKVHARWLEREIAKRGREAQLPLKQRAA